MTDREEFEKFLNDNFLYDTSGFIQNEAERKKAQDESFVWRAWQARGELDAVRIEELEEWVNELIDNRKEFIEALRGMVSSYEYEASSQNPSLLVAKELLKELDK